eukprot:2552050-Amphidinium_carterae.1
MGNHSQGFTVSGAQSDAFLPTNCPNSQKWKNTFPNNVARFLIQQCITQHCTQQRQQLSKVPKLVHSEEQSNNTVRRGHLCSYCSKFASMRRSCMC